MLVPTNGAASPHARRPRLRLDRLGRGLADGVLFTPESDHPADVRHEKNNPNDHHRDFVRAHVNHSDSQMTAPMPSQPTANYSLATSAMESDAFCDGDKYQTPEYLSIPEGW